MSRGSAAKDDAFDRAGAALETRLIEHVLAACEWSDDQSEIADLVDHLVDTADVQPGGLLPATT